MNKKRSIRVCLTLLFLILVAGHLLLNASYYRNLEQDYTAYQSSLFPDYHPLKEIPTNEAYRFFWDRTFHHRVLLTVLVNDNQATLNVLMVAGPGSTNYQPGTVLVNRDATLTPEQVQKLRRMTRGIYIRRLLIPRYISLSGIGLDGAGWIIEWKRYGMSHVDYRWSPTTGRVRAMGLYLLELSQLPLAPGEIY